MISLVKILPDANGESAALARIKCTFSAYGNYPDIALFWEQTDENGNLISLISRLEENVTVWSEKVDDELESFIAALGAATVFADEPVAMALGITGKRLCAVAATGGTGGYANISTDRLYSVFKQEFDIGRDSFIADVSHRLRHGAARCIAEDDSAAFMQLGESCGYITGVAVDKHRRKKGQGSALLSRLISGEGKIRIYACCSERVLPFYLKNNFVEITPCVIGSF